MKKRWMAILIAAVMMVSLTACGGGEEETTLTGMVVAVDGSTISLMEMDMTGMEMPSGDRTQMPEGMEGFQEFGGFVPGDFDGIMPQGEGYPQWGDGEMPEDMTIPEGMKMPEGGQMPGFFGGGEGMMSGFGGFTSNVETQEMDIGKAHISVEIDGGKASGSMDDVKAGTFVTLTINGKGEVTYVLVSSRSFSGGSRRPAN